MFATFCALATFAALLVLTLRRRAGNHPAAAVTH
jgi:hypothetical protein